MINIYLIVLMCVFPVLLLAGNIYLLVYFQHTEDKYTAWIAKFVVLACLELAECSILMLPLDVANRGPPYGHIPMDIIWLVVYIVMAAMAILAVPFFMFFYEMEEAENNRIICQVVWGLVAVFVVLFLFTVVTAVSYIFLGVAEVKTMRLTSYPQLLPNVTYNFTSSEVEASSSSSTPVAHSSSSSGPSVTNHTGRAKEPPEASAPALHSKRSANTSSSSSSEFFWSSNSASSGNEDDGFVINVTTATCSNCTKKKVIAEIRVSPVLYIITITSLAGWCLMIFFGGIGLAALPLDLMFAIRYRPKRITESEYKKQKVEIANRTDKLIEIGERIKENKRIGRFCLTCELVEFFLKLL
eukprot:TRINITY_DN587_c0_g2_i2.p1 TRINITY_DN587_c0_g2~~TRINITY_DN587_c0_g2_i2.p1  ORF type:complete len:401 (-),score=89.91 TRINITY_DN587_c0_g2_i2:31-1098(-)